MNPTNEHSTKTSDGKNIVVCMPSLGPLFRANGTYRQNCNKSTIQNMGNTKATLFRGFTLMPGGSITIGLSYDFGKSIGDIPIDFDPVSLDPLEPTPINRVEILEYHVNHPDLSFFSGYGKTH